jgi:FOG: GGDEF domain
MSIRSRQINDTYGNPVGDKVLVAIADILKQNIRVTDVVGRWSGEEFLIILPDTDKKGAVTLAEKIRTIVENTNFETVLKLTSSFGVSTYRQDLLPATLISRAHVGPESGQRKRKKPSGVAIIKASKLKIEFLEVTGGYEAIKDFSD